MKRALARLVRQILRDYAQVDEWHFVAVCLVQQKLGLRCVSRRGVNISRITVGPLDNLMKDPTVVWLSRRLLRVLRAVVREMATVNAR